MTIPARQLDIRPIRSAPNRLHVNRVIHSNRPRIARRHSAVRTQRRKLRMPVLKTFDMRGETSRRRCSPSNLRGTARNSRSSPQQGSSARDVQRGTSRNLQHPSSPRDASAHRGKTNTPYRWPSPKTSPPSARGTPRIPPPTPRALRSSARSNRRSSRARIRATQSTPPPAQVRPRSAKTSRASAASAS